MSGGREALFYSAQTQNHKLDLHLGQRGENAWQSIGKMAKSDFDFDSDFDNLSCRNAEICG
jgi:hypothetical protein